MPLHDRDNSNADLRHSEGQAKSLVAVLLLATMRFCHHDANGRWLLVLFTHDSSSDRAKQSFAVERRSDSGGSSNFGSCSIVCLHFHGHVEGLLHRYRLEMLQIPDNSSQCISSHVYYSRRRQPGAIVQLSFARL